LVGVCERNLQTAGESDLPLFVTTPDLMEYLPGAVWIPLVVDITSWATDQPLLERDRPIVLHAPSARWTKGTERFLDEVRALHNQGLIELKLAEGVPWSKMRQLVQDAAETVARLVADRTEGIRIGQKAAAYVRAFHDGTKSAAVLNGFLDS
jgi:hypothetical protein